MRMRIGVAAAASAALLLSACASNEAAPPGADGGANGNGGTPGLSGTLSGKGASSMEAAQGYWTAQFQTANPDVTVNYAGEGSGAGREAFAAGAADFAGSDRAMKPDEVTADALKGSKCAEGSSAMNLPVYIGPIALIYNIDGVDSLQLDPETIAKIFRGDIKKWNDPAIVKENEGVTLPDATITPVHRADDSGTTENLTEYLQANVPDVWTDEPDGVWPKTLGGEGADKTSGMVDTVKNGKNTIGYADFSKAGGLGLVKVKVGDEYVEVSAQTASEIVAQSPKSTEAGLSPNDQSIEVERKGEGQVYPIVLVSYAIACDAYKDPKVAALVKGYLGYVASPEGQEGAAGPSVAGSAPLPDKVSAAVAQSIAAIK